MESCARGCLRSLAYIVVIFLGCLWTLACFILILTPTFIYVVLKCCCSSGSEDEDTDLFGYAVHEAVQWSREGWHVLSWLIEPAEPQIIQLDPEARAGESPIAIVDPSGGVWIRLPERSVLRTEDGGAPPPPRYIASEEGRLEQPN
jgi:hypothetical protein